MVRDLALEEQKSELLTSIGRILLDTACTVIETEAVIAESIWRLQGERDTGWARWLGEF